MANVQIYTDGACSGNPGPGGWGALLISGDRRKELQGGEAETTNNRMELLAAIRALEALTRPTVVDLHTDSTYVRNGITQWMQAWKARGWKTADKKPVKNEDLWQRLDDLNSRHDVTWHWVKGHAGHPENERADALARAGMAPFKGGAPGSTDAPTAPAGPVYRIPGLDGARIRKADPRDAAALVALVQDLASHQGDPDTAFDLPAAERDLIGPAAAVETLVAETAEGERTGFATFHAGYELTRAVRGLHLADIYVAPAHRKSGIGTALMTAVAAIARERGLQFVGWLRLASNEEPISFYRRVASVEVPVMAYAVYGPDLDRLSADAVEELPSKMDD